MMIVVVAMQEVTRRTVAAELEAIGVRVTLLESLGLLPATLKEMAANGILLELITSAKSSAEDKQATNEIIQLFPNAKFKMGGDRLMLLGSGLTMESFVEGCRSFEARVIRRHERRKRHIAYIISPNSQFTVTERVVSMNVSVDGCFLSSMNEWTVGHRVWMRFVDNDLVVTGTVRWWQPWGNNMKMPGIGVKFDNDED